MTTWQNSRADIDDLLEQETWVVVGLSGDPTRTAYSIANLLQSHGKRIVPVHPNAPTVLGEKGYPTLADIPFPVDVVDVFRNPDEVPPIAQDAIDVRAGALWMQLGIENQVAADLARAAGLDVVMNHCMLIEHRKLGVQA